MMVGAEALVGSSNTPRWPAAPTAVIVANRITTKVPAVPPSDRKTATIVMRNAANISGMTSGRSFIGASANDILSIDTPVVLISNSGY
jgi:hypothetical protein